jgi:hypothetical protein
MPVFAAKRSTGRRRITLNDVLKPRPIQTDEEVDLFWQLAALHKMQYQPMTSDWNMFTARVWTATGCHTTYTMKTTRHIREFAEQHAKRFEFSRAVQVSASATPAPQPAPGAAALSGVTNSTVQQGRGTGSGKAKQTRQNSCQACRFHTGKSVPAKSIHRQTCPYKACTCPQCAKARNKMQAGNKRVKAQKLGVEVEDVN